MNMFLTLRQSEKSVTLHESVTLLSQTSVDEVRKFLRWRRDPRLLKGRTTSRRLFRHISVNINMAKRLDAYLFKYINTYRHISSKFKDLLRSVILNNLTIN